MATAPQASPRIAVIANLDHGCSLRTLNVREARIEIDKATTAVKKLLEIQPRCVVYGRECRQRRDVGFFSNVSFGYKFSGQIAKAIPVPPELTCLIDYVNRQFGSAYNGVLVNRYVDGTNNIGYHSDSEVDLDIVAGVVAISVGVARKFRIKDKKTDTTVYEHRTGTYEALQMHGADFQKYYTHGIPQEKRVRGVRYSFTFRRHTK